MFKVITVIILLNEWNGLSIYHNPLEIIEEMTDVEVTKYDRFMVSLTLSITTVLQTVLLRSVARGCCGIR